MKRKQRFIVDYTRFNKETFLSMSGTALIGITDNLDFINAPITVLDYKTAYDLMVDAAPYAVRNNIDGLRVFKPLRENVEGMLSKLADFAQGTIGNNPDRMTASGIPLTKAPGARPGDINQTVVNPKVTPGNVSGNINVSVRTNPAADGIVIEERQPDNSYIEKARVVGFKTTLGGYTPDEVVVFQIRYWNKQGLGPRMARPLAIVA